MIFRMQFHCFQTLSLHFKVPWPLKAYILFCYVFCSKFCIVNWHICYTVSNHLVSSSLYSVVFWKVTSWLLSHAVALDIEWIIYWQHPDERHWDERSIATGFQPIILLFSSWLLMKYIWISIFPSGWIHLWLYYLHTFCRKMVCHSVLVLF